MFNPLNMLRELRDDDHLTSIEFAILVVAVLRTDNRTGRVRVDQAQLAEDAKVSLATVKRVYRSKEFRKYFETSRELYRGRWCLMLDWVPGVSPGVTPGVTVTPDRCHADTPSTSTTTPSTKPVREDYPDGYLGTEKYLEDIDLWTMAPTGPYASGTQGAEGSY